MMLENLTWQEFEKAVKKTQTVIIPIGPMEQHGPHLPLGSDFIHPYEIAKRVSEKINVLIHPPLPVGGINKARYIPGTISVQGRILEELIFDICENLVRHKIKKILVLSGHASSFHTPFIKNALNKISKKHKIKTFYLVDADCSGNICNRIIETQNDKHAGERETSIMLALRKDLVKRAKFSKEFPPIEKIAKNIKNVRKYWKTGIYGDATRATLRKGRKLVEEQVNYITRILTDK